MYAGYNDDTKIFFQIVSLLMQRRYESMKSKEIVPVFVVFVIVVALVNVVVVVVVTAVNAAAVSLLFLLLTFFEGFSSH